MASPDASVLAIGPRSRVVTDPAGWAWAEPRPAALRLAAGAVAVPAVLAAGLIAAAVETAPRALALTMVGAWLAGVALAGFAVWRRGTARLGVSPVGLALQSGLRPHELAWRAVTRLSPGDRSRTGLVVVRVEHDHGAVLAPLGLDPAVACAWLTRARSLAPPEVEVAGGNRPSRG